MTVQVQFECAFLGKESSKLSATAWGHQLCNTTQDTHYPWEDILESHFTQTRFGTGTGALIIGTRCIVVIREESRDHSDCKSLLNSNMRESQVKGLQRSKSSFRSSKGRNHPFEDTPSPQYKRNIAQVSQFYISLWPNENQSGSYHETHLWPWPLSEAFPFITSFVSLSERDEVYQGKASTRDDVAFLFSFTLADMDVYCWLLKGKK